MIRCFDLAKYWPGWLILALAFANLSATRTDYSVASKEAALATQVLSKEMNLAPAPGKILDQTTANVSEELSTKDRLEVFEKVWKDINDYYYDPSFKGVNWQQIHQRYLPLVEAVKTDREFYMLMNKMTGELHDAHTRVLSPTLLANLKQQQSVSPGFRADEVEGKPVVTGVILESEAARAGIEPGMIVLTVDGQPVADKIAQVRKAISPSSSDRYDRIRVYASVFAGQLGTALKLGLQRADGSNFEVAVTRKVLSDAPDLTARLLPSGYAYIAFNQFTPEISRELKDNLTKLRAAPGLIIDLRINSGGSNRGLYPIVEDFYNVKTLFLRNTTRTGKPFAELPLEMYLGREGGQVYSGPVVILVSPRSGSTTEMFAAGMQETGRAKVVGSQSCGCVVGINKQRELKGGGVLQISEVLWLTPKGRKLEGEGVIPDKTVVATISDLQQKRDPVIAEGEDVLRKMSSR